jgi:hypothetical protein
MGLKDWFKSKSSGNPGVVWGNVSSRAQSAREAGLVDIEVSAYSW